MLKKLKELAEMRQFSRFYGDEMLVDTATVLKMIAVVEDAKTLANNVLGWRLEEDCLDRTWWIYKLLVLSKQC